MNTNLMQMVSQLQSNPAKFLPMLGVDIPRNMTDPNEIINYLMRTGQVSQAQYDRAVKTAQQFR